METKNFKYAPLIAAICFTVLAFFAMIGFFGSVGTLFKLFGRHWLSLIVMLLNLGGYVVMAVSLYMKRRDILAQVGIGLLGVAAILSFFTGLKGANFLSILISLLGLVGYLGLVFVALCTITPWLDGSEQVKTTAKKLWFVPAACVAAVVVLSFFSLFAVGFYRFAMVLGSMFSYLVIAVAFLFTAMWLVYPEGLPYKASEKQGTCQGDGYFGMVGHVLLLVFTFGIWNLIWIYRMTGYTNRTEGEPYRNPTTKLLLCLFVPLYEVYWVYQTALRMDKYAESKGVACKLTNLCTILSVICPFMAPIMIQERVNCIAITQQAEVQN